MSGFAATPAILRGNKLLGGAGAAAQATEAGAYDWLPSPRDHRAQRGQLRDRAPPRRSRRSKGVSTSSIRARAITAPSSPPGSAFRRSCWFCIWLLFQGPVINTLAAVELAARHHRRPRSGPDQSLAERDQVGRRRQHFRRAEPRGAGGRASATSAGRRSPATPWSPPRSASRCSVCLFASAPHQPAIPGAPWRRAHSDRADDRLLADRHSHHARHPSVAADRGLAVLRPRVAVRILLRPELGAADPHPRRPSDGRRRVRRHPGVRRHAADLRRSPWLVAIPIGLYSAIYLTEYAHPQGSRAVIKPVLELLAGIPTVVYGFFAVLTVAPAMRDFGETIGIPIAPNSALAAGGGHGHHDHPVHLVAVGRRHRRRAARHARRLLRHGRDQRRDHHQGAAARRAAGHHGRHPARRRAGPSARP